MQLTDILTNVLEAEGYDVHQPGPVDGRSGTRYAIPMAVEQDGERELVDVVTGRPVRSKHVHALASIAEDAGFDGAHLLALGGSDEDLDDVPGVRVWTRETLEGRIGAWLLRASLDGAELSFEDAALELEPIRVLNPPAEPEVAPEAPEEGSDAGWLTDPPEPPEERGREPDPTPAEVADDGSDAEWLTDPPEPPEEREAEPDPTPDQVADDGSDAEWLTDPPEPPQQREAEPESTPGDPEEPEQVSPKPTVVPGHGEGGFLAGACLTPRLDEGDAWAKAEQAVYHVREATLELLPFHAFDYDCVLRGSGTEREAKGQVWVSAENGSVVEAPAAELVEELPMAFEKLDPNLGPEQAASQAQTFLEGSLTVREEVRQEFGESAIIERIELSPDPETVRLRHQGLVHVPRWRVEGQNGSVYVDAVTGDLVSTR